MCIFDNIIDICDEQSRPGLAVMLFDGLFLSVLKMYELESLTLFVYQF